jgi:hypothetical protein
MKKLLLSGLLLIFTISIYSQVEITPTFGYSVNGKVKTATGYLNVKGDISYGAILDIGIARNTFLELSYNRSTPTVVEEGFSGGRELDRFETGIEHYQIGSLREFEIANEQVVPFAKFTVGASRYFSRSGVFNYDSVFFSMSFGGGVKIFFNDNIGLRLQSTLLLPSAWGGSNVYCGWGGCYPYSSYYIPIVHWDNSLGLIFRID